jgi:hypothetical protein
VVLSVYLADCRKKAAIQGFSGGNASGGRIHAGAETGKSLQEAVL